MNFPSGRTPHLPSGWIGRPAVGVDASREGAGAAVPVIEAVLSSGGMIDEVAVSVLVADEAVIVGSASVLDGEDGEKATDDGCSPKKEQIGRASCREIVF